MNPNLLDITLHSIGLLLSLLIGLSSYKGYRVTASPTMLRLTLAFLSLSLAFLLNVIEFYFTGVHTITFIPTTIAYFFLAYAYTIQSGFKYMIPLLALITFAISPFFSISGNVIEYVSKATAFILLVYGGTESMVIALPKARIDKSSLLIPTGLSLIALGEFVSWYDLIFTNTRVYFYASMIIKISGLALIYATIHILLTKTRVRFSSSN
jgi:hypothetical protein